MSLDTASVHICLPVIPEMTPEGAAVNWYADPVANDLIFRVGKLEVGRGQWPQPPLTCRSRRLMNDCRRGCAVGTANKGRGRIVHGRKILYQGERIVSDLGIKQRIQQAD